MQSSAPCTESENLYKNVYCAPSNSFPTRAVMEGNRMFGFLFVMEEESIKLKKMTREWIKMFVKELSINLSQKPKQKTYNYV